MSESCRTNDYLSALTIEQPQQLEHTGPNTSPAKDKRTKSHSTSSNGTIADSKCPSYRRRPGTTKTFTTGSDIGTSRSAQRSTASPTNMSPVNYTKTGRISKAKKGLKVHDCECGRSYTRAEHLRRHQRNHAQEGAMACTYPGCDKTFFRSDLLQRHEERHSELGRDSRQSSVSSTEQSTHPSPRTVPCSLPVVTASTLLPAVSYQQQHVMSPQPEVTPFPRYNPSLFRAPQPPRTPKMVSSNFSNPVFPSSQHFRSPTNDLKHSNLAYPTRHSISGPVLVDTTTSGVWQEPFAPSPYSCSSGYASPAPGPEYSHVYATPPYGPAVVRTRASSNASYIEQTWQHASQSPTSSVAMPYSWPSDEKNVIPSSFAFMPVSYATSDMPMHASIDAMSQYTQYDTRTVIQLDTEEGLQLFPGEHYGMSQIARAYPFEQWLNNYWRLFHPAFPIIHRFTFARGDLSPMLYAAMIAIDLHYSGDTGHNLRARQLHKQCVRLLLQRQLMNRTGCDRLCDSQAIFLVEVFSQYCAQRCSKTLSPQFELMYEKLASVRALHPSAIFGLEVLHPAPESKATDRWVQWARLLARQHLVLSCYILDSQQYTLLARCRDPPLHTLSDNLPFPVHESVREATTASDWAAAAQQQQHTMPITIQEAWRFRGTTYYDVFQSAVLIAAYHEQVNGSVSGLDFEFEQLLSQSPTTRLQLLTTKLAHLLPMRALLATSGETWIFGTKLTSENECSRLKSTLRSWVGQIWSPDVDKSTSMTTKALSISVAIIKLSLESSRPLTLGLGNELGFFLAALALWTAVAGATSRLSVSSFSPQRPQPTLAQKHGMRAASTIDSHSYTANTTESLEPTHVTTGIQSSAFHTPLERRSSIPYMEIFSDTSRFVATAIDDISSFDLASCHAGGTSLLLWVKMHLRNAFPNATDSTEINASSTGLERGEVISWTINQIERMLTRGWDSWDI